MFFKIIPNKCFFLMDSLWQLIKSTISRVGAGREWSTVEETGLSRRSWVYKFSYQAGLRYQQFQKLSKCGKLVPSYFSFLIRKHACATTDSIKLNLLSCVLGRQKWVSPQLLSQCQSECSHPNLDHWSRPWCCPTAPENRPQPDIHRVRLCCLGPAGRLVSFEIKTSSVPLELVLVTFDTTHECQESPMDLVVVALKWKQWWWHIFI